ncbi:MAG: hypothetical protein WEE89_07190 [Gemmatimonadota bacterium]
MSEEATIQIRRRITIMDGYVTTFALGFTERPGMTGMMYDATGPFRISASRNAVIVHRAEITDSQTLNLFIEAIKQAKVVAMGLSQEGNGNFQP